MGKQEHVDDIHARRDVTTQTVLFALRATLADHAPQILEELRLFLKQYECERSVAFVSLALQWNSILSQKKSCLTGPVGTALE